MTNSDYYVLQIYPKRLNLAISFLVITVVSLCFNLAFHPGYNKYHFIYLIGAVSLVIGASFGSLAFPTRENSNYFLEFYFRPKVVLVYKVLAWAGLLTSIYLFYAYGLGLNVGSNPLDNLRHAKTVENLSFYGTDYFGIFSIIVSSILRIQGRLSQSFFYFLASITTSFASAERTSILYYFVIYFGLGILSREKVNWKSLAFIFGALLFVFAIIAFFTNKLVDKDESLIFLKYFTYPLEALSVYNIRCQSLPIESVLGVLGKIIYYFGSDNVSSLCTETGFNVYSYIYKPLRLFGEIGFVCLMSTLGFLFVIIERKSRNSLPFLVLKCSLLFSIIMIFYDWTFGLTSHFYVFLFTLLAAGRYRV